MSSHHIIRENQEPALIIDDYDVISEDMLGQLLEWSPTVITNESGYLKLLLAGIKVDYILVPHSDNHFYSKISELLTEGIQLVSYSDKSFFEACGHLLQQLSNRNATVISLDFSPKELISFKSIHNVNLVLIRDDFRYVVSEKPYNKWKVKGSIFHIPEIENQFELRMEGLISLGNSFYETEDDGFITIQHTQNDLFVLGESLN